MKAHMAKIRLRKMGTMTWLHLLTGEKADFWNTVHIQSQAHNLKDKI
jgi:hypothetical protein